MADIEGRLEAHGIRPTAIRIMVLRAMLSENRALSQTDIESLLQTVDRSTVSRTLSVFIEHHLAHSFVGPDGITFYAVCPSAEHSDVHAHFTCLRCRRTTCLRELPVPAVSLPDGYRATAVSYLITGYCPDCR